MATATLISQQTRNRVASIPTYHDTIGEALNRIENILNTDGFGLVDPLLCNINQQEGRKNFEIQDISGDVLDNCVLVFMWYKMDVSGRYEITCYLS